jgi:hypothetical protein
MLAFPTGTRFARCLFISAYSDISFISFDSSLFSLRPLRSLRFNVLIRVFRAIRG